MELGRRSSFRMIAQLRFSGRSGDARLDARVRRVGDAGLAGQTGQVGPGRARAGLAGRAWSNNPNSPNYWFFGPIAKNTIRVQIIGQIGPQRGKPQIIAIFGKRSILSNNFWSEKYQ